MECKTSHITQTAVCLIPAINLPPDFPADATSTPAAVQGAAASFEAASRRADVYVGVRMNNPLSYQDLVAPLKFYPPPTVSPPGGVITVVRGETVSLTIMVGVTYLLITYFMSHSRWEL